MWRKHVPGRATVKRAAKDQALRSIKAPQANCIVEFAAMPRYIASMSPAVKTILEMMASWPVEDQEELSELAREIEAGAPAFIA